MSLGRNLAKSAVGFLFATFLTLAILSFSLVQITDEETLKPITLSIAEEQISDEQAAELHAQLLQVCDVEDTVELPIQDTTITIDCSKIRDSQPEDVLAIIYEDNIEQIYNREYDCEFLECVRTQPEVIVSAMANEFFLTATYISVFLTLVFAAILTYISKEGGIFSIIRSFGWTFIFVGVSYFLVFFAKTAIPTDISQTAGPAIDLILGIISFNLLIVLVIGVLITAISYAGPIVQKKKK